MFWRMDGARGREGRSSESGLDASAGGRAARCGASGKDLDNDHAAPAARARRAPPVLPIADVGSDRLGFDNPALEGFDQWIVSGAEHLDTRVAQHRENAVEAFPRLSVEPGPSRGFHND